MQCVNMTSGAMKRFASSVMDYLRPPLTFVCRLDLAARRTSLSPFIGRNPFAVSVNAAGIVDMSEFMTTCQAVSLDMPAADSNALLECNQFHGQDFRTMFTALVVMAYTSKSQWFLVFCGQMPMLATAVVESKFMTRAPPMEMAGKRRVVQRYASDVSDKATETLPFYNPKNIRHTRRETDRLLRAQRAIFSNSQFVSFGGPDGTKIGTDSNIFVGAVMDGVSGVTTWAMPQVYHPPYSGLFKKKNTTATPTLTQTCTPELVLSGHKFISFGPGACISLKGGADRDRE